MGARKASRTLRVADLFSGAGGTSSGISSACAKHGVGCHIVAVNHWPTAIATHKLNHPEARHICEDIDSISPRDAVPVGDLDYLWASPECIFHSRARGGKPIDDQRRVSAWCVARWAETLRPKVIDVENVPEFAEWGPIDVKTLLPVKSRRGETFRAWCNAIASLGYTLDHRVLCDADYGAATTRQRMFVRAFRGDRPVTWPAPTHAKRGDAGLPAWRPTRDIIDWSLPSTSIFSRKRPLSPNTMRRILKGLEKFGISDYIVAWDNTSTQAAQWGVDTPLTTIVTKARHGLVSPFIVELRGTQPGQIDNSAKSMDAPLHTVTAGGTHAGIITPYLIPQHSGGAPRSVEAPVPTICSTSRGIGMVTPMLVKYYKSGVCKSVDEPIDTLTCKARYGLAMPIVQKDGKLYRLDLHFRMIQPKELAAATGFNADYRFSGNKTDTVAQIGNAVPPPFSEALLSNVLPWLAGDRR